MAGFIDTIFNWLPKFRKPDSTLADAQCDANGALKVAIVSQSAVSTTWVDPAAGAPLAYQRLVATTPRALYTAIGTNEGTADRWFMLFDSAALAANGAEPKLATKVPVGAPFSFSFARGNAFATGVAWAISSTAANLTIDSGASFRVNVEVA